MRSLRLAFLLLGLLAALAPAVGAEDRTADESLGALLLPTRRADADALRERARSLADAMARRWSWPGVRDSSSDGNELGARLAHASAQFKEGRLDEAATTFDAAIEEGARNPARVIDPRSFVNAHMARVAIALARGETERAHELVGRLLRYDPTVTPSEGEESPLMHQVFAEERAKLGTAPPIGRRDLQGACDGRVLLVARPLADGVLELSRFDDCRLVAHTLSRTDADDERAVGVLAEPAPARAPQVRRADATLAPVTTMPAPWPPWTLGAAGLVVAASGAAVLGVSLHEYNERHDSACGRASMCAPSSYAGWERAQPASIALIAIGGAGLVGGIIWGVVTSRKRHEPARPLATRSSAWPRF
jgi:hypothetical protein